MYAFFFLMGFAILFALVAIPVLTAVFAPWWATVLVILAELVFLRYNLLRILGMMFAVFVNVGLRLGTMYMRGTRVEVHGVTTVPKPDLALVPKLNTGSVDLEEHEAAVLEPDPPARTTSSSIAPSPPQPTPPAPRATSSPADSPSPPKASPCRNSRPRAIRPKPAKSSPPPSSKTAP